MPVTRGRNRRVPQLLSRVFYVAAVIVVLREVFHGTRWRC